MTHPAKDDLLRRIRPGMPHSGFMREQIHDLFGLRDRIDAQRQKIMEDKLKSDEGKLKAVQELAKDTLKDFAQASRAYRRARDHNASARVALKPKPCDPNDPVGEMRRQELRSLVRGLPVGKRVSAAMDPAVAEALLDAHPILSGLTQQQFDEVKGIYIKERFAKELAEVDAMDGDIGTVGSAVHIVRAELMKASGLPESEFGKIEEPALAEVDGR